jgi:hypothetical protein
MKQNVEEWLTCIKSSAIPFSMRSHVCVSDFAIGIGFYSHQGIDVDKIMERNNLLIGQKHGKEISLIQRWLDTNMARKYTSLKHLSQVFIEGNYLIFVGTRGHYIYVGEKSIIFRSVTFQNLVQNSYDARLVTHL